VNSWKVILATIVIYGAGVMTGGLLVNHVIHARPRYPHHPEFPGAYANFYSQTNGQPGSRPLHLPELMSRQFLQRLDERLHLTPEQRAAIQKVISDGQNSMHKTMLDTRLKIRAQLTPEQRRAFDELVRRPFRRPFGSTNAPSFRPPAKAPAAGTNAPGV
jgi:hypothetical protein